LQQILENNPQRRPSFFSQVIDNIKQEMAKNKEMKENIKKFRSEAEKLEHSEALQKARQKFQSVESEASKGSDALREKLDSLKDKMGEVMEEAGKSDIAKKAGKFLCSKTASCKHKNYFLFQVNLQKELEKQPEEQLRVFLRQAKN